MVTLRTPLTHFYKIEYQNDVTLNFFLFEYDLCEITLNMIAFDLLLSYYWWYKFTNYHYFHRPQNAGIIHYFANKQKQMNINKHCSKSTSQILIRHAPPPNAYFVHGEHFDNMNRLLFSVSILTYDYILMHMRKAFHTYKLNGTP